MGSVVCCRPCRFDDADDDDGDPYGPPRSSRGRGSPGSKSEYDALTREDAVRIKKWLQGKGKGSSNKRQKSETSQLDLARKELINEMINFETLYTRALEDLHIHFVLPLCDPKSDIISQEQAMRIFSNIGALEAFHRRFLDQLRTSVNTVELFQQEFCEFLDNYRFYVTSFHLCLQTVDRVAKRPEFQKLLDSVRQEYSIELMPLLFAPIEQLSIYTRFLNSLMDVTHPMHADFAMLQEAATRVAELFVELSERKAAMLNMTTMLAVQNRLRGDFESFVRPDRRFICDGELDQLSTSVSSVRETSLRVVFVFNDILIWATDRYKFKGVVDLTRVSIDMHYEEVAPLTSATPAATAIGSLPEAAAAGGEDDGSGSQRPTQPPQPSVNGIQMYQPTAKPPLLVLLFRSATQKRDWLEALKQIPSPHKRRSDSTQSIGFSTMSYNSSGGIGQGLGIGQRRVSRISVASADYSDGTPRQQPPPQLAANRPPPSQSPSLHSSRSPGVLSRTSSSLLPDPNSPRYLDEDDVASSIGGPAPVTYVTKQQPTQFGEVSGSGTSMKKPKPKKPNSRTLSASSLFGNGAGAGAGGGAATGTNAHNDSSSAKAKPTSYLSERLRRSFTNGGSAGASGGATGNTNNQHDADPHAAKKRVSSSSASSKAAAPSSVKSTSYLSERLRRSFTNLDAAAGTYDSDYGRRGAAPAARAPSSAKSTSFLSERLRRDR